METVCVLTVDKGNKRHLVENNMTFYISNNLVFLPQMHRGSGVSFIQD